MSTWAVLSRFGHVFSSADRADSSRWSGGFVIVRPSWGWLVVEEEVPHYCSPSPLIVGCLSQMCGRVITAFLHAQHHSWPWIMTPGGVTWYRSVPTLAWDVEATVYVCAVAIPVCSYC